MKTLSANRRNVLKYLGSSLSLGTLSLTISEESLSSVDSSAKDFLALNNIENEVLRLAKHQIRCGGVQADTVWVVQAYLQEPNSKNSINRVEQRIHRDFVIGRTAILDGWVISETEMVLLASVNSR